MRPEGLTWDPLSSPVHLVHRISLVLVIVFHLISLSFAIDFFRLLSTILKMTFPLGVVLEHDKIKIGRRRREKKNGFTAEKKVFSSRNIRVKDAFSKGMAFYFFFIVDNIKGGREKLA